MKTCKRQRQLEAQVKDGEYDLTFIIKNPIPSICKNCKYKWVGRDAITAPSLYNCICFWCKGPLIPLDFEEYRARLAVLHFYIIPEQMRLPLNTME
jgi:hypothetical protein